MPNKVFDALAIQQELNKIEGKAEKSYVDNNLSFINSSLEEKASKSTVNTLTDKIAENANNILTIDSALSTKASKDTANSLQSQIDTLVLSSGGDSNLEVVQGRIDSVGSTYNTLKDHLDNIENMFPTGKTTLSFGDWEVGGLDSGTGTNITSTTRIRTSNFHEFSPNKTVNIEVQSGYRIYCLFYDDSEAYQGNSGWKTSNFELERSYPKFKFMISETTETTATTSLANYIKFSHDIDLTLPNKSVTTDSIKNRNVTNKKISNEAVTPEKTNFFNITIGTNKYNKNSTTEGYYYEYNTGVKKENTGFTYSALDSINSNTQYTVNLSSVQICFYDIEENYISGFLSSASDRSFTTPFNAKYYIASVNKDYISQFMLVEGDTVGTYESYTKTEKIKSQYLPNGSDGVGNLILVDCGGNGDYSTIQEAVDNAIDGDTLWIMPGTYKENVNVDSKCLNIIGVAREKCILTSTDNRYEYPPLEIAKGYIANLTIYAEKLPDATPPDSSIHNGYTPYAVHIDWVASCDSDLTFENCTLKSDWNAGAGIGMRKNFKLIFRNCDLISTDTTSTNGGLYLHDANASGTYGRGDIVVDTCNIKSSSAIAIMPASSGVVTEDNSVYMHMYRNIIYSEINGKANSCVGVGRPVTGDGWRQYNNFFLTGDSFGNNIDLFNA